VGGIERVQDAPAGDRARDDRQVIVMPIATISPASGSVDPAHADRRTMFRKKMQPGVNASIYEQIAAGLEEMGFVIEQARGETRARAVDRTLTAAKRARNAEAR